MQSGHHNPIHPAVEERKGKALVSTGVVERTEPNKTNVPDDGGHNPHQLIMLGAHLTYRGGGRAHCSQVICQHSGCAFFTHVTENCIEPALDGAASAIDPKGPDQDSTEDDGEHRPEEDAVREELARIHMYLSRGGLRESIASTRNWLAMYNCGASDVDIRPGLSTVTWPS